jgi:CheY-like chemotaxis protein
MRKQMPNLPAVPLIRKSVSQLTTLVGVRPRVSDWGSAALDQPTILVCEDEYFIRTDMSDHLREEGYRIIEAKDADRAQSLFLSGERIDLLCTDVVMPGTMDGLELAQWVRQRYPTVRIIVVTGWAKHERVGRNYDAFLMKPCDPRELARQVKALVVTH